MSRLLALARNALLAFAAVGAWSGDARALDPLKAPSQYVARAWHQSDDGLPQNFVTSIAQTPDGYLWLATQEGLVRFDGVRFVIFSTGNVPELKTNDVYALLVDRKGTLWIGTRGGGLTRYAKGAFKTYLPKDGLAHDFVMSLHEARDGSLWIGTRGGGVSRMQGETFTTYRASDGLANNTVSTIAELADGTIWLGTDAGLSRFEHGAFTTLGADHSVILSLFADADGALWIGTKGRGLERLKDSAITTLRATDGLGSDSVFAITRDGDRNLWIGTDGGGVLRLSQTPGAPGTATSLGAIAPLGRFDDRGAMVIHSFFEDREKNLWIGLESFGLVRLKDGKVTTYAQGEGLPSDNVWSMLEDPSGTLWVGTKTGLARQTAPARFGPATTAVDPIAAHANILSLGVSPGGGLWIGTDGAGLELFRPGGSVVYDVAHGFPNDIVRAVHEDARGTTWVGTYANGLTRITDGKIDQLGAREGFPNFVPTAFADAADGSLWIGTDGGGLVHRVGERFTVLSSKDGLSNDIVQALYADGDDLWIGTYGGGIDRLHDGKLGKITEHEGLFNDVVFTLVDDGAGNLWMTCNKGIFRANKREMIDVLEGKTPRISSLALGTLDGMRASECNGGGPGGARTRDGRLWFPTVAGLAMVDPAHLTKNLAPPPVRIEEVDVDRAPVDLADSPDLKPGSRDFAFEYTALSFTTPEKVRFKYRLEGFDKDWVDAGARRVAYYTNLAPHAYRFRVIAANDDGVWNDEGASVAFRLAPHFWQTAWFYAACALGLVFTGAFSVRMRLYALRARARELEQKVEERTVQLGEANTELRSAFKALAEKDALLHEDLLQAQAFQERILPRIPTGGPLRIRALYKPADLVGGDIYDVCEIGDGHYRVFLADTTGHGVQASLRTMVLKTEYDRLKIADDGPAAVLAELNRKIAKVYPGLEMRCSACCFDVIANGYGGGARVVYANAAHPPLLRVSDGKVHEIYASGTFLGIVAEAAFTESELKLEEGDLLVAYTDGVCEQENPNGQAFGIERMSELLAARARDADGAIRVLDEEMMKFAAGKPLGDDVAIVCIECLADRTSTMEALR